MDLIEQLFCLDPDSGAGSLVLLILLVVAAVIVVAVLWLAPPVRTAVWRYIGPVLERVIGRD